jgi:hypothetical protein
VTDYRATEQELWDEDAGGEDDRKTLLIPPRGASVPPAASEEPLSVSAATSVAPAAPTGKPASPATSVDHVARFIAEPGLIAPSAERELDAPRRSIAALELLDAEYGAEATVKRAPPTPPALPKHVRPRVEDLPSMLLGPSLSTRKDVTERMTAIPMTHPLANSIAPGGSPVSTPPHAHKRSLRSQLALGALALLVIGAGASGFLQSRGEHHAASGQRGERGEDLDAPSLARRDGPDPLFATPPLQAPVPSEAAHVAHASRALGEPLSATLPVARTQPDQPAQPEPEPGRAVDVASSSATEPVARKTRIAVGGAQLRPRAAETTTPAPQQEVSPAVERAQVVAAMNALTPQLRACVGDEHGVVDVTLTVRAPGVVSHALVEGPFAGSDKGSCIARTLRSAKLPVFAAPSDQTVARVEYPFQL